MAWLVFGLRVQSFHPSCRLHPRSHGRSLSAAEVNVDVARTENWLLNGLTTAEGDRMSVLSHMHALQPEAYQAALATLVATLA